MKNAKVALFLALAFVLLAAPGFAAPSADLGKVVQDFRLVDLTITLDENTPVSWPTHVPFQRKIFNYYGEVKVPAGNTVISNKNGPYFTETLLVDEHTGTHFDAPNHFIPPAGSGFEHEAEVGKITGDKVDLNRLMGNAVVIDVTSLSGTGANGVSPWIQPSHIKAWEDKHGKIQPGEVVLLYSGWDAYCVPGEAGKEYAYNAFVLGKKPGWPSPSVDTMQYLYERGVVCVGTDGPSMGAAHEGAPVHWFGLGKGILYVESLHNLDKLPPRGSYFMFMPLKVVGSSGCPGRAVAFAPR